MIEDLIDMARKRKLRVANLYEMTHGGWRCALYRRPDDLTSKWLSGTGSTAEGALSAALSLKPKPRLLSSDLDDIL